MVSIEKPVKATPALLRALHCFGRNPFSDREDCSSFSLGLRFFRQNSFSDRRDRLSFSLAEHLYGARLQVSHCGHILPSGDYLVAIRESI